MPATAQSGRVGTLGALVAACVLLALALASPVSAQPTTPIPDARAAQALQRGFWVVEPGDHLYRIARHFATTEDEARRLANELKQLNDHAIMSNDAAKLVVGARIHLPKRMLGDLPAAEASARSAPAASASEAGAAPPPATPPPATASRTAPPRTPPRTRTPGTPEPSGVPPLAANAPEPAAPVAVAPAAPVYVDRVLASSGDDRELGLDDVPRDGTPGLRQWGAELRTENRRLSGSGSAQAEGIAARYGMETERFGDFTVLGQLTHLRPPDDSPKGERTRASGTLLHDNFALGGGYTANSALGVIRPLFPFWLTTSYRVNFAPSLLSGVQTAISSPDSDLRVGAGRIGQLGGQGIQQFERTSGEQAVASYAHRLGPEWSVGGAAIAVRDSDVIRDHTTASVAVQRDAGPADPAGKLQLAITDEGEKAGWFDARVRSGRLLQRFGAYHVDPDFIFGESGSARDVRGAYWRGEYRAAGNFYSFGAEASQDNLRRDPTRGGNDSYGGYANMTLRLDRTFQAGVGGSLRREEPRVAGGERRDIGYANVFASKSWESAVTRLDANVNTSRPAGSAPDITRFVGWTQEWPRLGPVDFSTQLSHTREDLADRNVRRQLASVTTRGPVFGDLRWDASLTFVDIEDSRAGGERNYNASLGLDWNPLPRWTFQLLWFRNRVQPGPDNPLSPFLKEDVVQFNARYEDSAGTPYPRVAGGRSGSGRIQGSVFYDENGDGVRQPSERGAPGVQVVLDERQAAVTDSDGRFQFSLIPAGTHRLRALTERIALPWGLADESPREVRLETRGDARTDFGLTRISP
jgi:hypothetical protein